MNALRTAPQTFLAWPMGHGDGFQLTNHKYLVKVYKALMKFVVQLWPSEK